MSMQPSRSALIIFADLAPSAQLRKQWGEEKAQDIYPFLVHQTHSLAMSSGCDVHVYYRGNIPEVDLWDIGFAEKFARTGDTPQEQVGQAIEATFAAGYEHAIVIGCECLHLQTSHIRRALNELNDVDVVLGPQRDGGCYLLGLSEARPSLLEKLDGDTEDCFEAAIEELIESGTSWYELPILAGHPTAQDVERIAMQALPVP